MANGVAMRWRNRSSAIINVMLQLLVIIQELVSSENFHWIWQDSDTCPRVDMCPQSNVSSKNFH